MICEYLCLLKSLRPVCICACQLEASFGLLVLGWFVQHESAFGFSNRIEKPQIIYCRELGFVISLPEL